MKVGDKVRVTAGYSKLDGRAGFVVGIDDKVVLVDFGREIDLGCGNVLHGGSLGNGRKHYFWFQMYELMPEPSDVIKVVVTYVRPDLEDYHIAKTHIEGACSTVEGAIENAILEFGLADYPDWIQSVSAVKMKRD